MDTPQAVQTASEGQSCRQCGNPLPKRPSAKEHHFCNAKCRAAWHRGAKQRSLNAALRIVDGWNPPLDRPGDRLKLDELRHELVAAGAEPS
jgi:hypothetical protein